MKDLARKLGIDLTDDSFLRQSILADGRLEKGDAIMVKTTGRTFISGPRGALNINCDYRLV